MGSSKMIFLGCILLQGILGHDYEGYRKIDVFTPRAEIRELIEQFATFDEWRSSKSGVTFTLSEYEWAQLQPLLKQSATKFNVSDIDIGRLAAESRRGVKEDFMHNYMIYIDGQQYESWHGYQANMVSARGVMYISTSIFLARLALAQH